MRMFKVLNQGNFHNVTEKRVRPLATYLDEGSGCLMGRVSPRTLTAICKHYCGVADCKCGSGPAVIYPCNDRLFEKGEGDYWISIVK